MKLQYKLCKTPFPYPYFFSSYKPQIHNNHLKIIVDLPHQLRGLIMLNDLVGIGMRPAHYEKLTNEQVNIGWLEVHSENHFEINSEATYYLDKACERYPISLHGIGLSLASNELIDTVHVNNIKKLITRYSPFNVSEHLGWCDIASQSYSQKLNVAYTEANLKHVINRVNQVQQILEHEISIENPASYQNSTANTLTELEFINVLHQETGCKLLLDINNVHISSCHLEFNAVEYINELPISLISEIHLSGSRNSGAANHPLFTEHHGHKISREVWTLFAHYLQRSSRTPTLIERDINIPKLSELLQEAKMAKEMISRAGKLRQAS